MTGAILQLLLVIGSAAAGAISVAAAAAQVDSFSYRAFDATTAHDLVVMARSNTSELTPATGLFDDDHGGSGGGELNRTEGYLLLSRAVNAWHAGRLKASFNASFAVTASGAAARVAFVVLCVDDRNSYPVLGSVIGYLKVVDDGTAAAAAAPGAVWVEYDASARRLLVYEAASGGAGQAARPAVPVVNERIGEGADAKFTTGKAMVGFFAGSIQDIVDGVRDWNMTTVDSSGCDGWKKGTSWWIMVFVLLVVLGSVAAMAGSV